MSIRTLMIVALALVFGGSAAVGIGKLRPDSEGGKADTVSIVVTAIDIPRGRTITGEMLQTKECQKDLVPMGASTRTEDLIDRVCFMPMFKGEPVIDAKLTAKGAGRGMGALTKPGMRSFTIPTPSIASGVAGF